MKELMKNIEGARPDAYTGISGEKTTRICLCSKDKYYGGFYGWGTHLWESLATYADHREALKALGLMI